MFAMCVEEDTTREVLPSYRTGPHQAGPELRLPEARMYLIVDQ